MEYALFAVWSILVFLAGILGERVYRKKANKLAEIAEKIKERVQ